MPLTVCLVVLGRYVPHLEFLFVLLGDEPVLSPKAHFYQRLLALDQQEAQSVVDAFLKERTLVEVHDVVIIPALSMAEQDRHKGELDDAKAAFIMQSISEIIGLIAESDASPTIAPVSHADVRILCVPANDEADGITAAMLSQVLERAGFPVICLPVADSITESVASMAAVEPQPGDVVCICALPPFALLKARSLSKQLHARFPGVKIVVGLWNFSGSQSATERFGKAFEHPVVTTLADALGEVESYAASIRQPQEV
jgi:methylmalonyl-CoA mutase cobalamin-binding subunit